MLFCCIFLARFPLLQVFPKSWGYYDEYDLWVSILGCFFTISRQISAVPFGCTLVDHRNRFLVANEIHQDIFFSSEFKKTIGKTFETKRSELNFLDCVVMYVIAGRQESVIPFLIFDRIYASLERTNPAID